MKLRYKIISVLLVLLVATSIIIYINFQNKEGFNLFSPIEINSDSELEAFIQDNNFEGAGTFTDPYIIDYVLINQSTEVSLTIHNTRSHVVIENSYFTNALFQGIWLWNVENIMVKYNQFINSRGDAIYVNSSKNVVVDSNTITGIIAIGNGLYNGLLNFAVAIDVQYSTRIDVINNDISKSYDGIWFWGYSNESTIVNNRMVDLDLHGIGFGGPETFNLTISGNYIEDVNFGMWLLGPEGNSIIRENTIINAYNGLRIFTKQLIIESNYFEDVSDFGIYIQSNNGFSDRGREHVISNNTFIEIINDAIYIEGPTGRDMTIMYNNFISSNTGSPGETAIVDSGTTNLVIRNYYANFTGSDSDNDGYYDDPYILDGNANNEDTQPLVNIISYERIE